MPRLNNPIVIEITRDNGRKITIDVIPVYEEERHGFVATDELRLYEGYPADEWNTPADEAQRERYLDNLDMMGEANPCYFGLLQYAIGHDGRWGFCGDGLTAYELQQVIAVIESYLADMGSIESEIEEILNEPPAGESQSFLYHNGFRSDMVRVDANGGSFLIMINEEVAAEIEFRDARWVITAGHMEDPDLLLEVISHIRQTKLG